MRVLAARDDLQRGRAASAALVFRRGETARCQAGFVVGRARQTPRARIQRRPSARDGFLVCASHDSHVYCGLGATEYLRRYVRP
jgi:hypothetical protein